ncbi:MAG: hypothetical protein KDJ75_04940 [Alphaproteobacteria bacterium]|nr:hypothetical protein [Alphaproteobacteria bacterium]
MAKNPDNGYRENNASIGETLAEQVFPSQEPFAGLTGAPPDQTPETLSQEDPAGMRFDRLYQQEGSGFYQAVRDFTQSFDLNRISATIPSHLNFLSFLDKIAGPREQQDPRAFEAAVQAAIDNETLSEVNIFSLSGVLPVALQALLMNRIRSEAGEHYSHGQEKGRDNDHFHLEMLWSEMALHELQEAYEELSAGLAYIRDRQAGVLEQQVAVDTKIDTALEAVENLNESKNYVTYTVPFVEAERIVYQDEQGGYYYIGDNGENYPVPDSALEAITTQLAEGKLIADADMAAAERENRLAANDGLSESFDLFVQEEDLLAQEADTQVALEQVEQEALRRGVTLEAATAGTTTDTDFEAPAPAPDAGQMAIDANINDIASAIAGSVMMSKDQVLEMAAEKGIPESHFDQLLTELDARPDIHMTDKNLVTVKNTQEFTASKMSVEKDMDAGKTSLAFGGAAANTPQTTQPGPAYQQDGPQQQANNTLAFNPMG